MKKTTEHKFKIGQLVRHKASDIIGTRMIVTAIGTFENEQDAENIYALSYETHGDFRRTILHECELVAANEIA